MRKLTMLVLVPSYAAFLTGCGQGTTNPVVDMAASPYAVPSPGAEVSGDVITASLDRIESTHMELSMTAGTTSDMVKIDVEADSRTGSRTSSQAAWSIAGHGIGAKTIEVRLPGRGDAYLNLADYGSEGTWVRSADVEGLGLRDGFVYPLGLVEDIAEGVESAVYEDDDPWKAAPVGPRYRVKLPSSALGESFVGVAEMGKAELPEFLEVYFWTDDEGRPVTLVFDPDDENAKFSMRIDFSEHDKDFVVETPPAGAVEDQGTGKS
ncbi:hypothetical protein ACFU7D_09690 [Nocardioides sp. NPDC057577]|uniref:hypothetical protein n=1 Tax=Nocardioides sp. NPDC057577 TaxID=3346171 RepID=UPI00366EE76C